jgi:SAM-dependent methyltransferase
MTFVDYFTQVQATQGWDAILASFARFVAPPAGARILDVGCGPGSLARRFAAGGHPVVGVDIAPDMVARARALAQGLPGVEFHVGEITHLPFPPASFDVVTAANVVFFLDDPLAGLRGLVKACRQGGVVAMLNPSELMSVAAAEALANERNLQGAERVSLTNWAGVAERNRRMSASEVADLFAAAGLRQVETVAKIGPGLARFVRGLR